jgi:hypothetical protein
MSDFNQQELVFGQTGLNFQRTLDQLQPTDFSIATNVIVDKEGRVTGRPGQLSIVSSLGQPIVHTLLRLENPVGGDLLLIGSNNNLSYAPITGGAPISIEGNFSLDPPITGVGNPFSWLIGHTALTGEPWAFFADPAKMKKVRANGALILPIGLPKAGVLVAAVSPVSQTGIDSFDNTGPWTNNAGTGGAPTNSYDFTNFKQGTASLNLTSAVGAATAGYYNFWAKAYTIDLNNAPGPRPQSRGGQPVIVPRPRGGAGGTGTTEDTIAARRIASDEDHFHLWVRTDRPDKMLEFRIYFVISSSFNTVTVPGTSATLNTDAYVKILRPSDFVPVTELTTGSTAQSQVANLIQQIIDELPQVVDGRLSVADIIAQIERARAATQQLAPGRGAWTEYGVTGRTVQRGEFRRIGSDTSRTWANVTGIICVLQTVDNTSGINVWLDDFYFFGGAGPDTSAPGSSQYDYRSINYDPRTGCRSLPSDVFADTQKVDSIRTKIYLTPSPYGDANVHQRFFRRGGSLGTDWLYVGENTADGASFTDDQSDLEIIAADPLKQDDDGPVTTTDRSGNTVYNQPLSSIFGPVSDIVFGCGDPYHRGRLYWSKPSEYEHWPATNFVDVCPDGEELLVGFRLGGQAFIFSRQRLYSIYPNLSDSRIVSTQPTSCQKAPVARWCIAVGFGLCFFIERDGIYATNGGPEENITEETLRPLFKSRDVGNPILTRRAIDFSATQSLRLFIEGDYLWFLFKDLAGTQRALRMNIPQKYWEGFFDYGQETPYVVYDDVLGQQTLLGGGANVYVSTGSADIRGASVIPITATFYTGALNQSMPRQKKHYSDAYVEFEGLNQTITLTPYTNNFATAQTPSALTGTSARSRFYADFTDTVAYDLGIGITWTVPTNQVPLYIYKGGISYLPQPDETEQRVTEWDAAGRLVDKWVKGVVLDCDTLGVDKSILVQSDGATIATITANANGRQIKEFSFAQALGRLLRLKPQADTKWILYNHSWIFDEEPLSLLRWETQELACGAVGWKTPTYAHITLKSNGIVTFTVIAYREDGTSVSNAYQILSTGGVKQTRYVMFSATKGVLYKFTSTSDAGHYIYREETIVHFHNWTTGEDSDNKIFGTDDLDLVRNSQNAQLTAGRT